MTSRLLLTLCIGTALIAGEPVVAGSTPPWIDSFTTQVRGKDRHFVELGGKTFILITVEEIASGIGDGQDVALAGKLRRQSNGLFGLYRADGLTIEAVGQALAGRLDGDNLYLVGSLNAGPGGRTYAVRTTAPALSDTQLLQARLIGIAEDDWDRRLGVVNWCRDQARMAGNADFWSATADGLLGTIVLDLGAKAAERKDMALINRALDLSLNQLRDQGLAARVVSPVWIREHGGAAAEIIARRMRGLGYALYKNQWLPRPQALETEYEDRFKAMEWKDAEGFYRLGRWADENAEGLPRARERSWRCYQAGNAADPTHVGIARELGVAPRAATGTIALAGPGAGSGAGLAADLVDAESGMRIKAPPGWRRGPQSGDGTAWLDPKSETAQIIVRVLRAPVDDAAQWSVLSGEMMARPGFVELSNTIDDNPGRRQHALRYHWTEGEQQHLAMLILVATTNGPAAVIRVQGLPTEQPQLEQAVSQVIAGISRQSVEAPPEAP